jgi:hypothetical protein
MIVAWARSAWKTRPESASPVREGMIGDPDVFSFRMSFSKGRDRTVFGWAIAVSLKIRQGVIIIPSLTGRALWRVFQALRAKLRSFSPSGTVNWAIGSKDANLSAALPTYWAHGLRFGV